MSLITEYPAWFILFCIALALLITGILYFKNQREEFPQTTVIWLSVLRFLAVFIISFLLLSPLVKNEFRKEEKPMLIFAQDNSGSVVIGEDSSFYRNEFPEGFDCNKSSSYSSSFF